MSSKQPRSWWQEIRRDLDLGAAVVAQFVHQVCCWRTEFKEHRDANRMPRCYGRQIRRKRRRVIIIKETR